MASLPLKSYVETRGEPHSQPGLNLVNTQLNWNEVNYLPLIPSLWGECGSGGGGKAG